MLDSSQNNAKIYMQDELFPSSILDQKVSALQPKIRKARDNSLIVVFGKGCEGVAYLTLREFTTLVAEAKAGRYDSLTNPTH